MPPRESTLSNGLRVVTDPISTVESACVGLWVGAGTRHETAEVNGVAHLLEHMAFKGTRRRNAQDIAQEIEAVGGHLNAYTSRENTAYYARILKQDAPLALDILADILQNSVFDETELGRERAVVLQEIGQAIDTPDDIIFDQFQEAAFPDQPIGWPVLGTADIVGSLPREAIAGYIGRNYGADTMVLVASGNVDHDRLAEQAERLLTSLPAKAEARTSPAAYQGGEHREERDLEQLHLVLGFPGLSYTDPDFYAASVLSTLLGGGMSSRLFQEIREKRGLVYSIYSFTSAYQDGGLFGIYAGTGETEVEELLPVLCGEIGRVVGDAAEDEVARARAQIKAGLLMSLESTMARAEQLGQQMLIFGRPVPPEEVVAKIDAIDAAAVRRVAERVFRTAPTLAALGPVGRLESYDAIRARIG
ncbi:M16 family metallopeptidase [Inquilinus sp. YAF38]|uniref:M16 family metallopeptidase n=1 Tax=Inquilinus sp. YAF38 TaxID=3233084 RepID=UPI003F8E44E6